MDGFWDKNRKRRHDDSPFVAKKRKTQPETPARPFTRPSVAEAPNKPSVAAAPNRSFIKPSVGGGSAGTFIKPWVSGSTPAANRGKCTANERLKRLRDALEESKKNPQAVQILQTPSLPKPSWLDNNVTNSSFQDVPNRSSQWKNTSASSQFRNQGSWRMPHTSKPSETVFKVPYEQKYTSHQNKQRSNKSVQNRLTALKEPFKPSSLTNAKHYNQPNEPKNQFNRNTTATPVDNISKLHARKQIGKTPVWNTERLHTEDNRNSPYRLSQVDQIGKTPVWNIPEFSNKNVWNDAVWDNKLSSVAVPFTSFEGISEPQPSFGSCANSGPWSGSPKPDSSTLNEDTYMDWTPFNEEEMMNDIKIAREMLMSQNQTITPQIIQSASQIPQATPKTESSTNNTYIIVDTNVFMDKLNILANILHISYEDGSYPVIYVPWMVIQELDYFKDGYSNRNETHVMGKVMQNLCRRAIRFINDCLVSKRKNFMCQSVQDAAENRIKHTSPDDSILSCCFQVADRNRIILLSGDINLRNKAMINNFDAHRPEDIVRILGQKKHKMKANIVDKLKESLSLTCSFIIYSECQERVRNTSTDRFTKMPWPLWECVTYMKENYNCIFKGFLQKQCQKVIDDIYENFIIDKGPPDEKKFVELMLALLIYIKTGLPKYEPNVQKAIVEIKKLEKLI